MKLPINHEEAQFAQVTTAQMHFTMQQASALSVSPIDSARIAEQSQGFGRE